MSLAMRRRLARSQSVKPRQKVRRCPGKVEADADARQAVQVAKEAAEASALAASKASFGASFVVLFG
jgi:hypothetical protein